jgi:hypothetical protein
MRGIFRIINRTPIDFFHKVSAIGAQFGLNVWKWNDMRLENYQPNFSIINEPFENEIERSILGSLRGVRVLCQPSGFGKTTSLFRVIDKMKSQQSISSVIYNSGFHNNYESLYQSIFPFLPWPMPGYLSFSDYMKNDYSQPIVIILDHFDYARSHDDAKLLLLLLAHDSVLTKKYVVLVIVNDPAFAHEILNLNSGEKFYNIQLSHYQWTDDNLLQLLHYQLKYTYPVQFNNTENIEKIENMDELIKLIQKARTPAFVKTAVNFYIDPFTKSFKDNNNTLKNSAEKLANDSIRITNSHLL